MGMGSPGDTPGLPVVFPSAENQHQTRSKKVTFEKEMEMEISQKDKSKKPIRHETSRIEEISARHGFVNPRG